MSTCTGDTFCQKPGCGRHADDPDKPCAGRKITPPGEGAVKYDAGKIPVWRGCLAYFPRALAAVANVSAFGYSKYKGWGGWRKVENREERYADALARHQMEVATGGLRAIDPETNCYHLAQLAWNALALLDVVIEEDGKQREFKPYSQIEEALRWQPGDLKVPKEPRALKQADEIVRYACPDHDDLWCNPPGDTGRIDVI